MDAPHFHIILQSLELPAIVRVGDASAGLGLEGGPPAQNQQVPAVRAVKRTESCCTTNLTLEWSTASPIRRNRSTLSTPVCLSRPALKGASQQSGLPSMFPYSQLTHFMQDQLVTRHQAAEAPLSLLSARLTVEQGAVDGKRGWVQQGAGGRQVKQTTGRQNFPAKHTEPVLLQSCETARK